MLKTLEQLSMPTRADVVSIAERMTNIEMRLDDLDAKLDGIQALIAKAGAAPLAEPRNAPQRSKPPQPSKKSRQCEKSEEGEEVGWQKLRL